MNLSVIGLGKLGLCTAMCFAEKGIQVVGVDNNERLIQVLTLGKCPIEEPGLSHLIEKAKGNVVFTTDYSLAIKDTDITMIVVPTPSKTDGSFDNSYIEQVLLNISPYLKQKKDFHIIDIVSTVMPGSCEKVFIPMIEKETGKRCGKEFGLVYNPEFIALGSVIRDFKNPDMVLIGASDKTSAIKIKALYESMVENCPEYKIMSIISAEITKISLNSYITMKISFANTLANICEKIPEANIDDITKALGADRRIAPYYLKGGLSYGGPCFPRDNRAFAAFAQKYGVDAKLAKTTDEINQIHLRNLVEKVIECANADSSNMVAVLGLAYKPNTPVIEESPAIKLIESLLENNVTVIAYDPLAMDNAKAHFGDKIIYASSIRDCFSNARVCVITTEADELRHIDETYIVHSPTTIVDCWRVLGRLKFIDGVRYIPIGEKVLQI